MRILAVIILIALFSCGGRLSDEERRELQEEKARREIRKVTDQEIVQEALETGQQIRKELNSGIAAEELEARYEALIREVHPGEEGVSEIETELWEAYLAGWQAGEPLNENVQRDYPDYLYYTYPLYRNDSLTGMMSVRLSRKEIIVNQ